MRDFTPVIRCRNDFSYGKYLSLSLNKECLAIERIDKLNKDEVLKLAIKMLKEYYAKQSESALQAPSNI